MHIRCWLERGEHVGELDALCTHGFDERFGDPGGKSKDFFDAVGLDVQTWKTGSTAEIGLIFEAADAHGEQERIMESRRGSAGRLGHGLA